ncbi:MAG TPA: hypothetical protein VFH24_00650, partial [Gemmatimonadales bacterium]|nr:hypothetical protein [Gemmatimonadales bacterium]
MTYTFKLARRLAVSRNCIMLPVLLVIAACNGDTTAPEGPTDPPTTSTDWRTRDITPVAVEVSPSTVTIETNQLIHFRAHGRTSAGDSVAAAVTWSTSGGTILPDGRFSAAAIGTYTVTGVNRVRGKTQIDTSTVQVVRRPTRLAAVEISPTNVSLTPGVSQTFTALGRLIGGDVVPIGVNWTANGGSIDAGGTYVAGDTAGTYRVIAINTAGTLADTVSVTITAPPTPPPPPPAPTATSITLLPAAWTLSPSSTKRFSAYGKTADGDSVAVGVTFTATGGTITSDGLYTAGGTVGTFRVVAKSGALADTSVISITRPLGSGSPTGIPFGPFGTWDGLSFRPYTESFTLSHTSFDASNIISRLSIARTAGVRQLPSLTGGARANYLTNGVFDMAKWKAKMNTYNTPEIRAAVAAAVEDGTLLGNSVMDEPGNDGGPGNEANSWGPKGTLNKARVDSMCAYVKNIFPTLTVGVFHDYLGFEPDESYAVCDFIVSQYRIAKGDINQYRDGGLALANRDGHAILFSLNILDGGFRAANDGLWNCPLSTTGGRGTYAPNCRMTPQQIRDFGMILGPAGCGLVMWRYETDMMANVAYQDAFKYVGDRLS